MSIDAYTIKELNEIGFTDEEIIRKNIEIDYETMGDINVELEGTFEQWYTVLDKSKHSQQLVKDKKEIIGYIDFVAVNDSAYNLLRTGVLNEIDLTNERVVGIDAPGEYKGFFSQIAITSEYRTFENFIKLFGSFRKMMWEYERQGVIFEEWCTNAYTPEGERLCKILGMVYVCDNQHGGKIYEFK